MANLISLYAPPNKHLECLQLAMGMKFTIGGVCDCILEVPYNTSSIYDNCRIYGGAHQTLLDDWKLCDRKDLAVASVTDNRNTFNFVFYLPIQEM